jgi:aquaporin Z
MTVAEAPPRVPPATSRGHWHEYAMEAVLLGLFMVSACAFTVLLEHPASPVHRAIPDAFVRRMLIGLAMGATLVTLVYSPWGQQSGAHMNPAVTLVFARLGKVPRADAGGYVAGQFLGGIVGVGLVRLALGQLAAAREVRYAATVPGARGAAVAFVAEAAISFVLFLMVLAATNHPRWARWTGVFAGALVAFYITFEAPLSGMSMNPARTMGSALFAHEWSAVWLYFLAPLLGMLAAAELFTSVRGRRAVFCAKLHHQNGRRCIFCEARGTNRGTAAF